jgi:RHS repeat-associated protein
MKKGVIFLILLVVCVSFSYAKIVEVPGINEGDSEPLRDDTGVKKFIYVEGSIIASVEDSDIKYYHKDRLSNRLTTDSSGQLDEEFKSLPFGQKIMNSGLDYPFTGKEEDESSLYYFGARYYDDNLGRFTSVDPVADEPAYQYVSNNPMNYVDPDGEKDYAVVVGFKKLNILSDAQSHYNSVIYGLYTRGLSSEDTIDLIIAYHSDLENYYYTENQRKNGQSAADVLKGNIGGKSYGGYTEKGMIENLEVYTELTDVNINLIFTRFDENQEENMKILDALFDQYSEVITLSHGLTKDKDTFTFLDGLGISTFENYFSISNWLDISCGSTCLLDRFSYSDSTDGSGNYDGLVRHWDDVSTMSEIGPSLKDEFSDLEQYLTNEWK